MITLTSIINIQLGYRSIPVRQVRPPNTRLTANRQNCAMLRYDALFICCAVVGDQVAVGDKILIPAAVIYKVYIYDDTIL